MDGAPVLRFCASFFLLYLFFKTELYKYLSKHGTKKTSDNLRKL